MAPQLQSCYWVSSLLRLPHPAPWPCSAHAQRRRVLRLAPPRRPYAGVVRVVADAGPALALEADFPMKEGLGGAGGREEDEEEDLDERERLRRLRISKANKGNTPWNKGRKHSPETLQRIRERTRIAMQDPKKLMVQDGCFVEWRDMIADAARKGFAGGVSLQWNSYKILTEKMRREWLENLQKKRSMPRPRGNRRAPKTPEQRRKIAEAIAAKWLDKEYRERVCSGIASYHGTSTGTRAPRKPRPAGEPGVKRQTVKKKPMQTEYVGLEDAQGKAIPVKRKKSATPYKDPMAGEKLEMITKIRAQRAALEIEKKEAIRRARSLIVEAERAANALETAAATSPFAQASLIEARKLVTEARASLECVYDVGHAESAPDETSENSATLDLHINDLDNQNQSSMIKQENKHVNGLKLPTSNVNGTGFHFDGSTPSETEKLYQRIEKSMERAFLLPAASSTLKDVNEDFGLIDFQVSQSMVDETERHNCNATKATEDCSLGALEEAASTSAENAETKENCTPEILDEDKGKMRWVRGRLVKLDNEAEHSEA